LNSKFVCVLTTDGASAATVQQQCSNRHLIGPPLLD